MSETRIVEVEGLFPVPLYTTELGRDLTDSEVKFLLELPKGPNGRNDRSTNTHILDFSILAELKSFATMCVEQYVQAVHRPTHFVRPYITESWVNYKSSGEAHHWHYHPNSFISGVFYVDADPDSDRIYFSNPNTPHFQIVTENLNPLNSALWFKPVKTGQLLLFPSPLWHMVPPITRDGTRVSLSFNTYLGGTLGESSSTTELVLEVPPG